MRITDQDIINTAQQLRDEENEQLHVRPVFNRAKSYRIPAWLVAVPAAAFVGFLLGLWTKGGTDYQQPLLAMTDTVYIKVKDTSPNADTTIHSIPQQVVVAERPHKTIRPRAAVHSHPIAEDKIRYDLLVKN